MSDDAQTSTTKTTSPLFDEIIQSLLTKQAELKEVKKMIKETEADVPMELEDKLLVLRDLKKEVKALKDDHLKMLLEQDAAYVENREKVQSLKEEIAEAKLALFTEASNLSRQHGDIDRTVMVEGAPRRLQTHKEISVYLDGRVLK